MGFILKVKIDGYTASFPWGLAFFGKAYVLATPIKG